MEGAWARLAMAGIRAIVKVLVECVRKPSSDEWLDERRALGRVAEQRSLSLRTHSSIILNPLFEKYTLLVKMDGFFKVERDESIGNTGQNWGQRNQNWKCIT
jgi:hypothetical protein